MAYGQFYGRYRYVRNLTWQVLLDFGVAKLPISTLRIAKKANVLVVPYDQAQEVIARFKLQNLVRQSAGFGIWADGQWIIYYDHTMNTGRIRFTVAHELGHIMLGHRGEVMQGGAILLSRMNAGDLDHSQRPREEHEADLFAARLLAPACALWGLGIHEWPDVQEICGMSEQAAKYRAERMALLYPRNRFLQEDDELRLYLQLLPWIQSRNPDAPKGRQ